MSKVKIKDLVSVTEEMQELCAFEPALKTAKKAEKFLVKQLGEAFKELTKKDKYSEEAKELFIQLEFMDDPDQEDPEDETPEEDNEEQEELVEDIEEAKKLGDLKTIAKENDAFDAISGRLSGYSSIKSLRTTMLGILDGSVTIKPEKPTEKKASAPKGKSQTDVIRTLINKGLKRETITKKLAKEFDKSDGWGNSRLKIYEKAYGDLGKKDKKLKG